MPKSQVDFAGPSYFGGKSDELVLCAGKGKPRNIHIPIAADLIFFSRGHTHMGSGIRGTASPCSSPRSRWGPDLHSLEPCRRQSFHVRHRKSWWRSTNMDKNWATIASSFFPGWAGWSASFLHSQLLAIWDGGHAAHRKPINTTGVRVVFCEQYGELDIVLW